MWKFYAVLKPPLTIYLFAAFPGNKKKRSEDRLFIASPDGDD